MPNPPSLTSTLQERTGLSPDELARPSPEDIEVLPPILPPEGVVAAKVRDVVAQAKTLRGKGRLDVCGVRGSAGTAVAASIARSGRHVVLVTGDLDGARRAAEDVGFLVRGP